VALAPDNPAVLSNLATAAEAQRLPLEAADALRSILKQAPQDLRVWLRFIKNLLATNDYVVVEEELKRLLNLGIGNQADIYNNYGVLCANQGATAQATTAFERAVQSNPKHEHAAYNLATSYLSQGRLNDAWEAFKKGLAADPAGGSEQRWEALLNAYLTQSQGQDALLLASMALIQHPSSAKIQLLLAWAQFLCGQLEAARETLNPLMQSAPELPMGWLLSAWISAQSELPDAALQALQKALHLLNSATFEPMQRSLLLLVQRLLRAGQVAPLAKLIDDNAHLRLSERWQPLRLALDVLLLNSLKELSHVPHELRVAAQQVLHELIGQEQQPSNPEVLVDEEV